MRQTSRNVSVLLLLLFALMAASVTQAQRMVFAHYMLANLNDVADSAPDAAILTSYQRQIQQAQAIGIDGFALNAGGWHQEPRYIRRASLMFEAALQLQSHFLLFFSADMCCSNDIDDLLDMMRRFAGNPRYRSIYFQKDNRAVLTTFAGSNRGPDFWLQLRHDLETGQHASTAKAPNAFSAVSGTPSNAPLPIFLVPAFFWGGELPTPSDIAAGLAPYQNLIDGAFYWGIAGVPGLGRPPDQIPSSNAYAQVLHHAAKLYMAPICFQFWGANAARYYDYSGYSGMRKLWLDAIQVTHPEWVEIITWNDFIEGSYITPMDDPANYPGANDLGASAAPASTLHHFHNHRGAYQLMRDYIAWYKTGHEPVIRQDEIFWAYRTQTLSAFQAISPKTKLYGPVADKLYLTANLTAPATLRVLTGGVWQEISLPAGSTDQELAILPGAAPSLQLRRGTSLLGETRADDAITTNPAYPNLYYSTGVLQTHEQRQSRQKSFSNK